MGYSLPNGVKMRDSLSCEQKGILLRFHFDLIACLININVCMLKCF